MEFYEQPLQFGIFIFPNGDKYDGQYVVVNGVPVRFGHGEHRTCNGMVYKGHWESDKMNGRGVLLHPSGSKYDGEFVNNMMHGHGTYTWSDGSSYDGPFHNNRIEGNGTYMDTRNQTWRGKFHKRFAKHLRFELNL